MRPRPVPGAFVLVALAVANGCGPKSVSEAEAKGDVAALAANPTGDSIAALGRLADHDPKAVSALETRAGSDVNVYIAAWSAVTRDAPWGTTMLRAGLADPVRAELASSALPRGDAHLAPLVSDLDGAVSRLASGRQGAVLAGILASIGPPAHAVIERRLVDAKTRAAMCDGIGLPEASPDAKKVLLAVPADARDSPSCVRAVMGMASSDDAVLNWLATSAEAGLLGAAATGTVPCPRLAILWKKALSERAPDAAMTVPLNRSIGRCGTAMDPVLGELLTKAPRARPTIVAAIDPFGSELAGMRETCGALKRGTTAGESRLVRERANDAVQQGCSFAAQR
jgi:hypothetical protein